MNGFEKSPSNVHSETLRILRLIEFATFIMPVLSSNVMFFLSTVANSIQNIVNRINGNYIFIGITPNRIQTSDYYCEVLPVCASIATA